MKNRPQRRPLHTVRNRVRIAQEAARLITESGIHDFEQARRKAAERLGIHDETLLPRLADVEQAVREHQRLFGSTTQPGALRQRRESALQAMQFLHAFRPRLSGAVLTGVAGDNSPVILHLHSDDTEAVQHFLHDQHIPAEARTWSLQLAGQTGRRHYPGWEFTADGIAFELVVLPEDALRHPPASADDGKPLPRATLAQLRQLLAE
ncbi:hypothetical protein ARC78_04035 [Stenotrophomonas pictorum JCM 9942]|jgi:hypothetical protein|uniref:Nucleotidyltransferase n=1 Tax=Stenotrophomonas pictorum JCM 9942 TaxID=1236960 RepID=A0A0R0AIS8_9GAMM|nr:hypothetical protein [Stenotrophomonas pictorum]KRG44989.1 hypothetical protein ARC78_04035 [Stenotrophomonas pictorum JCM 9942]